MKFSSCFLFYGQITWNNLLSGLVSNDSIFSKMWFWGIVYCVLAIPLALLKNLKVLAVPSMMGNIFIVTVSLIVIMFAFCFFSPLMSSFGIWKYGLQIDKEHLLWNTPLDLAKLFGVICYSLGVAVIGPTSYVPLSLAPSPLEHHEEAAAVHDGSDRVRCDRCARVHVARRAGRDVLLDGSQ